MSLPLNCPVGKILPRLRPGAEFTVYLYNKNPGEPIPQIEWNDKIQIQPSEKEILAEWEVMQQEETTAQEAMATKQEEKMNLHVDLKAMNPESQDFDVTEAVKKIHKFLFG